MMPRLHLENVDLEFPFYGAEGRSLRRAARKRLPGRVTVEKRVAVRALQDISLSLTEGDRLALIGPNGAGKTTLLKVMAGIYEPIRGRIRSDGKLQALLAPVLAMDPQATGWQNILLMGVYLGVRPAQMRRHMEEIAAWTELGAFMDAPLRSYSAGMMARLSFATATAIPSEILLLDEWLSAGDASFQHKAHERMSRHVERASILVLASHSLDLLENCCNKALLLAEGRAAEFGSFQSVRKAYEAMTA